MLTRRSLAVTSVALLLPAMLAGAHCSVEDEPLGAKPAATPTDDSGLDGALLPDGAPAVPGLCTRVGGAAQVSSIADAIFDAAAADCRIGAYFAALSADAATHVRECMRRQLGEMFQCEGSTYAGFKSSVGRECRNMATAHASLVGADGRPGLNEVDALAYNQAAQGAMKAKGLADNDVTKVLALFNALGSAVATRPTAATDRNTSCTCAGGMFGATPCVPDGGYVIAADAAADAAPDGPRDSAPDVAPEAAPADASDDGG